MRPYLELLFLPILVHASFLLHLSQCDARVNVRFRIEDHVEALVGLMTALFLVNYGLDIIQLTHDRLVSVANLNSLGEFKLMVYLALVSLTLVAQRWVELHV